MQQETRRIEPRLGLALFEDRLVPGPLLGVPCERPVVHLEPGQLVAAGLEGAGFQGRHAGDEVGWDRDGTAKLQQLPPERQTEARRPVVPFLAPEPQLDRAPTGGAHQVEGLAEDGPADAGRVLAVVGIDHEVQRPPARAAGDAGESDRLRTPGLPRQQRDGVRGRLSENRRRSLLIGHRRVPVGPGGPVEQLGYGLDVRGAHLPPDLDTGHRPGGYPAYRWRS
ncbi:MAG: hypothetical protein ACYDAD_03325 [Acidimicrobiales bacterium]